jgi:transcription elongation factor Elf1
MSVIIDRSFLLQVSGRLGMFTQKKDDLYNFRCPFCGDSQKHKTKARGYVFRKKDDYFYMCHNCSISTSFYNFLEKVDPAKTKEYALERFKSNSFGKNTNVSKEKIVEHELESNAPVFKKRLDIPTIESLPEEHYAKTYVKERQIPEQFFPELYYAEDFKRFVDFLGIEKEGLIENDPRLIIPFYNQQKKLIAIQGRALGNSKLRYITLKMSDDENKFFGLDRIDTEKMIRVVEGPIDSMFIENAIATADSNLPSVTKLFDKSKVVLIYDNEPRNKEIVKQMERAIEEHYNVLIWPEMVESKDINDMILEGFSQFEIEDIIEKHTFVNLRAKMEFVNWKKV